MALGSLRIIAGEYRGRRLRVPPGLGVRPTSDRVRESLFNLLGADVRGAVVLDPYAGSGALGFESLSRGAREVTFFEADRLVRRFLRQNAERLEVGDRCRILAGRAERLLSSPAAGGPFDLVLADPPYRAPGAGFFLEALERSGRLSPDARIVVQRGAGTVRVEKPEGRLTLYRSVAYGRTRLDFYRF